MVKYYTYIITIVFILIFVFFISILNIFYFKTKKYITVYNFNASWCEWSRKFAPIWDKINNFILSSKLKNNIKLENIDCDINNKNCDLYKIEEYPTIVLEKNGRKYYFKGNLEYNLIIDFIEKFI